MQLPAAAINGHEASRDAAEFESLVVWFISVLIIWIAVSVCLDACR